MNEEERRLKSAFDQASNRIHQVKTTPQDESQYAIAYQNLVKAGMAQQIKKKYRGK